jgi:hypothetical protein
LPGASARTIDLQDQQSSIGAQHSGQENKDQKEAQNLIYLRAANYNQVRHFTIIIRVEVAIHSTKYLQDKVFRSNNDNGQYFELHQKEY